MSSCSNATPTSAPTIIAAVTTTISSNSSSSSSSSSNNSSSSGSSSDGKSGGGSSAATAPTRGVSWRGWSNPKGHCERAACVRAHKTHLAALAGTTPTSPPSTEARSTDCDLVAAAPLEARQSAEAYARWLGALGQTVAAFLGHVGVLCELVSSYLNALAPGSTVEVYDAITPYFFRQYHLHTFDARATLGHALAHQYDHMQARVCAMRQGSAGVAEYRLQGVRSEPSGAAALEFTADGALDADGGSGRDTKRARVDGAPREGAAPSQSLDLAAAVALAARPLGLFIRRPLVPHVAHFGRGVSAPEEDLTNDAALWKMTPEEVAPRLHLVVTAVLAGVSPGERLPVLRTPATDTMAAAACCGRCAWWGHYIGLAALPLPPHVPVRLPGTVGGPVFAFPGGGQGWGAGEGPTGGHPGVRWVCRFKHAAELRVALLMGATRCSASGSTLPETEEARAALLALVRDGAPPAAIVDQATGRAHVSAWERFADDRHEGWTALCDAHPLPSACLASRRIPHAPPFALSPVADPAAGTSKPPA